VLLAIQTQTLEARRLVLRGALVGALWALAALAVVQIALGGWVSTNYAVLACRDFPTCQGAWWPPMDFAQGFRLRRELGAAVDGSYLPFAALTAIHQTHRIGAGVLLALLTWLVVRLATSGDVEPRRWALALAGVGLWQLGTGLGNVLLGWPLAAAVAHTGGAAALAVIVTAMLCRARSAQKAGAGHRHATVSARAAS